MLHFGWTICITLDNASNNDTMMEGLLNNQTFDDAECQVRCFAHVLNLSVQEAFKEFVDEVQNLRHIIKAIRYSSLKLEKLKLFCRQDSIKFLKPILDVKTRWNSLFDMLMRALYLRQPLERLIREMVIEDVEITGKLLANDRDHQSGMDIL